MPRIRDDDLQVVRERTDLVKVVSDYLTLKKSGHDSMTGLCPFHTEKSPSFSVSPSKQVYYCFGCGAGGDAVRFLQETEGLSFVEAVERLAKEAGVPLRYEGESPADRKAASRRAALQRANEEAAGLFHRLLLEGKEASEARDYLTSRGIGSEAIDTFRIGYAPGYPDFLLRRLSEGFGPETLLEAGLATKDDKGGVRDRFRGRVTFPIQDLAGKHIGFGARILPSDPRAGDLAKYLNTAETPIYRKGEILYNLARARAAITRSGEAFVVEGYTDVIAMAQAGIESAVATCGTALGAEHFRLLSRFGQRIVLSFDSDEAGARAAERAYAFHQDYPVQAVVMILPDGQDPADFVREHGSGALQEAASSARPLVEFMIRRTVAAHDRSTVEGQSAAVQAALPVVAGLTDPVRQREYAHLLAELAGVSESSVLIALDRAMQGRPVEAAKQVKRGSVQERVEREMLRLLARDRSLWDAFAPRLVPEHFRSSTQRSLFSSLVTAGGEVQRIVETAEEGDPLVAKVTALTVEPLEGAPTLAYAEGVWASLQHQLLKRQSDELRLELQKRNPTTDPEYDELFGRLVTLDGQLRQLRAGHEPAASTGA
ncbi:MAG: DNA primase [Actinomycetota bacterium]